MKAGSITATITGVCLLLAIPAQGQTATVLAARTEGGCHLASITDAPYSGTLDSIHTQTLADGTHIEREGAFIQVSRDSEGRQREELYQLRGPTGAQDRTLTSIAITDPVECVIYNLDVANQIARRRSFSAGGTGQEARRVEQPKTVTAPASRTVPEELRPKTSTEQIGADSIEGLAVKGVRNTTTYPVGSQGNDRPIVITREIWTSQELRVTVLEKTSDPRSGETTRRLANISRAEPSADLFRVPSDYKIEDEHQ